MDSYSLLEFNQYIKQQLKSAIPEFYWVVAEINEIHVNSAGHCFMELIEKASHNEQIVAKARANIWAYHFRMLCPYFETMTGQRLSAGLKVMLQVGVEFHELYGMSLQVVDINPAFTVGDLAIQRQLVIQKLTEEGVIDMNRELELTLVPQRVAVISSETAAGYGDFIDQLHHNPYGYAFYHTLFQATMQGNDAEESIVFALDQIFEREEEFDVVVVIRGGGSQSDLNCFNSYRLACSLAQFPLPVITGIGHDRDETIADRVACVPLKTPTAVAEFLINRAISFDSALQELAQQLADTVTYNIGLLLDHIQQLSRRLQTVMYSFAHVQDKSLQTYRLRLLHAASSLLSQKEMEQNRIDKTLQVITQKNIRLQNIKLSELQKQLIKSNRAMLTDKRKQIAWLGDKIQLLDPSNLLQRGYSITLAGGKVVRNINTLEQGQHIETLLYDGKIASIVEDIKPG